MEKFERKTVKFETKSEPVAAEPEIHFGFDPAEGCTNEFSDTTAAEYEAMTKEEKRTYLFGLLIK